MIDDLMMPNPIEHAGTKINSMMGNAGSARDSAAAALDGAARRVHQGADSISHIAHETGNRIDASARYMREHDAGEMLEDVRDTVRTHPGKSLLAALAIGLLVGRAFRSP
jgi:hypothetical protein